MRDQGIISNKAGSLSIRGGGLLGGFVKYLVLPIGVGIVPVILVNLWVAERDLGSTYLYVGTILGPFIILALIIDGVSFFAFQLKLQNDGALYVKGSSGPQGGPVEIRSNVRSVTSAKLETKAGMPFCLYEGNHLVAQWSTKPISLGSMQRFLRRLKEINPAISLNDYASEIAERGTTQKADRAMLVAFWPIFAGLGVLLYLPTLELVCVKILLGHLNWAQRSLQDLFYLSLIPLSVTTLLVAFAWDAKFWQSDGLRKVLRLAFLIPLFQSSSTLWAKHASLLTNAKLIAGVFMVVGFANLIFFVRPHAHAVKVLKALIAFSFAGIALTLHVLNFCDVFQAPVTIKNMRAMVDSIAGTRDGLRITFHFQDRSDKRWSFTVPQRRSVVDEGRFLSSGQLVNLYYAPHLGTLLKIEDALNGETIYRR